MAKSYDPHKLTSPQLFLAIMATCLVITAFVIAILNRQVAEAFYTNPLLNGFIGLVLGIGILLTFMQVISLIPEIRWVNHYLSDGDLTERNPPNLLAPMAEMLGHRAKERTISTQSLRSILESIGTRLDESRDISRYLIGLLVFLGLLGTFWGLLQTIGSIGDTISSLDASSGDGANLLDTLKQGLSEPLGGMGTAFSSSLFGLAGSLIVGFLDLWAGRAQSRFYTELENWLSSVTELEASVGIDTSGFAGNEAIQSALEQINANMQQGSAGNPRMVTAMASLAEGIQGLVKQMRSEQQLLRDWVEGQSEQQKDIRALLEKLNKDKK